SCSPKPFWFAQLSVGPTLAAAMASAFPLPRPFTLCLLPTSTTTRALLWDFPRLRAQPFVPTRSNSSSRDLPPGPALHSSQGGSAAAPTWRQESPVHLRIEIADGGSGRVDCAAHAGRVVRRGRCL